MRGGTRRRAHEALGRAALAAGHGLSADEHLTRAGVYYHFAKFVFVNDPAQMRAAHRKAIECRTLALPHLRPPGEHVLIPYQAREAAGPAEFLLIEDGNHVANNRIYRYRPQSGDWMAKHLGAV